MKVQCRDISGTYFQFQTASSLKCTYIDDRKQHYYLTDIIISRIKFCLDTSANWCGTS